MVTRAWKVFGYEGHRQRESFGPSYAWDCSEGDDVKFVAVDNSDKTGTNDYSIIRITRNTAKECEATLVGQLYDGAFENSRWGDVIEIDPTTGKREPIKQAKYNKLKEDYDLPELEGTPKQIAWAEKIRREKLVDYLDRTCPFPDRYPGDIPVSALKLAQQETAASFWLDNWDVPSYEIIDKLQRMRERDNEKQNLLHSRL